MPETRTSLPTSNSAKTAGPANLSGQQDQASPKNRQADRKRAQDQGRDGRRRFSREDPRGPDKGEAHHCTEPGTEADHCLGKAEWAYQ